MFQSRMATHAALVVASLALGACSMGPTRTDSRQLTANLTTASEVPPATGAAAGTVDARLNKRTSELSWTVGYSGLSGPVTSAHFHGPAMAGQNAGVQIPITGIMMSPLKGTATLTAQQIDELVAGKWYVNLHTAANPNGEIRGQLALQP